MPYYKVYFRWIDKYGKMHKEHTRTDRRNMSEAKAAVIRGEKGLGHMIAVDKIVKE